MEEFTVGKVVLILFPFSNLKGAKIRPALILAKSEFNNIILCQITSKSYSSKKATEIKKTDFLQGGLPLDSYARLDKIFTADRDIITKFIGELSKTKTRQILKNVRDLFIA